jgi:hypothetical protein
MKKPWRILSVVYAGNPELYMALPGVGLGKSNLLVAMLFG